MDLDIVLLFSSTDTHRENIEISRDAKLLESTWESYFTQLNISREMPLNLWAIYGCHDKKREHKLGFVAQSQLTKRQTDLTFLVSTFVYSHVVLAVMGTFFELYFLGSTRKLFLMSSAWNTSLEESQTEWSVTD